VPPLQEINRLLRRHRSTAALLGTLIVLGVAALDAHAALPEHHDHHGVATVCIAGLAMATLAALGWRAKPAARRGRVLRLFSLARAWSRSRTDAPRAMTRAGPPGPMPLRR
jgi:hypothetical protein